MKFYRNGFINITKKTYFYHKFPIILLFFPDQAPHEENHHDINNQ